MFEIVTINKADLLKRKSNVGKCQEIDIRYNDLFTKLDCFQSNYMIPASKLVKNGKEEHKRYHYSSRVMPIGNMINNKSTTKRLTSILNVLNEANYDKQAHKVFFLMKDEDIIQMTQLILDTCTMQVFYINLFIKLLLDISKTEHKKKVKNTINKFVEDFWDGKYMDLISPSGEFSKYDIFCFKQKHKTMCVSRGMVVLHLLQKNMVDSNTISLINFIKRQFLHIDENNSEDMRNHAIDIMLQILVEAKSILKLDPTETGIDFTRYITDNKTRFLCESLLHA
jgi:hypothetical protein